MSPNLSWHLSRLLSQGQPWKAKKRQGTKHCPGVGAMSLLCPVYSVAAKWRTEHTSCSAPWQGLSWVLVCHRILPTKPEAVYLVFGFGSLAHTLASEKAYQQFQLRLFPALLNHTLMSLAQKMCLCFVKINMLCFPSPCAFSPHLAKKEITL